MPTVLADDGVWWAGPVIGLVAAGVFVVFSGWILLQRARHNRRDDDG
jgi:hypothetical protein